MVLRLHAHSDKLAPRTHSTSILAPAICIKSTWKVLIPDFQCSLRFSQTHSMFWCHQKHIACQTHHWNNENGYAILIINTISLRCSNKILMICFHSECFVIRRTNANEQTNFLSHFDPSKRVLPLNWKWQFAQFNLFIPHAMFSNSPPCFIMWNNSIGFIFRMISYQSI